jgi:putative N6-adenine-specific DNA methylase
VQAHAPRYTRGVGEPVFTCMATSSFGLESIVRAEVDALGIPGARTEDRRVLFSGTALDMARCNISLRAADSVLIQAAEFAAPDFDSLYEGIRGIPWRDLCAPHAAVTVNARSAKSRLTAIPAIQSVSKRAIMDALSGSRPRAPARGPASPAGRAARTEGVRVPETGPPCDVEVILHADRAAVCIDTTGPGLHKRGYRQGAGEAPLRENLAAGLVALSRWAPPRPFADPLCGSGTIPIEAALSAAGIAPGLGRSFAGETCPLIPAKAWRDAREQARAGELRDPDIHIEASDRDSRVVALARRNAAAAGVDALIRFRTADVRDYSPEGTHGCVICNPPYGERLGGEREVQEITRALEALYRRASTWSLFVLSGREDFQRLFGARADRNRKLYNGNIRCWCYQYFRPPRPGGAPAGS